MKYNIFKLKSIFQKINKSLFLIGFIFILIFTSACYQENYYETEYFVRFVNYDDTLLYSTSVNEYEAAIYYGITPSKPETEFEEYEFVGWDHSLDYIDQDLTVRAVFKTIIKAIDLSKIELSHYNVNLFTYESIKLELQFYPDNATDKSIEWTSSDPNIASVNELGLVVANDVGIATITVTSKYNGVSSSCEVTVSKPPVDVEEIVISGNSSFDLTTNGGAFINYIIYPDDATDKKLTFESSDESVVTVSESGYMKAVRPGYARITIRAHNGINALVYVNVYSRIESIHLDEESATLSKGQSIHLSAYVYPYDVIDSGLTWTSSNPSVATVDSDGYVRAISSGTTTIKVSANANSSFYKTCIITVSNADSIRFYNSGLPESIGSGDAYITDITYKATDSGSSLSVQFTISGYVTRNVQGMAFTLVIKNSSGSTVARINHLDIITVRQKNQTFDIRMSRTLDPGYYELSIEPYYIFG